MGTQTENREDLFLPGICICETSFQQNDYSRSKPFCLLFVCKKCAVFVHCEQKRFRREGAQWKKQGAATMLQSIRETGQAGGNWNGPRDACPFPFLSPVLPDHRGWISSNSPRRAGEYNPVVWGIETRRIILPVRIRQTDDLPGRLCRRQICCIDARILQIVVKREGHFHSPPDPQLIPAILRSPSDVFVF